jgi:hypothetical protein
LGVNNFLFSAFFLFAMVNPVSYSVQQNIYSLQKYLKLNVYPNQQSNTI